MSPIGILFLLFLAKGAKSSAAAPSTKARTKFLGKSGRLWFVVDSTEGKTKQPVRSVFDSPTGSDMVLKFAVLPGGVRGWLFKAPSVLTPIAVKDFDVSDFQAKL